MQPSSVNFTALLMSIFKWEVFYAGVTNYCRQQKAATNRHAVQLLKFNNRTNTTNSAHRLTSSTTGVMINHHGPVYYNYQSCKIISYCHISDITLEKKYLFSLWIKLVNLICEYVSEKLNNGEWRNHKEKTKTFFSFYNLKYIAT